MKMRISILMLIMGTFLMACKKEADISKTMDEQFYVRSGDADMPVYVRGNGTSNVFILILHGGPGDGGFKYANHPFSNALEKDYAMVYWDQRHQGNSHGHLKAEEVTIDAMVEDTYTVIKTLKSRYGNDISLFLMGHSWGGALGTAFMIKDDYQYEVKGWIESAGAHDFPLMNKEIIKMIQTIAPTEIQNGNSVEKWQEALDYVNQIDTNNITIKQTTKLNQYGGICENLITTLNPKSTSELGDLERLFLSQDNPIITTSNQAQIPESFYEEISRLSLTDQLHKIETPTLLLWGKYDFKVPPGLAKKALEKLGTPNKFLTVFDQSGHSSMRYQPGDFVENVRLFIEAYK